MKPVSAATLLNAKSIFAAVAVSAVTPVGNLTLLSLYLINPQITCCCASSESVSPNASVKHAPAPLVNAQPEVWFHLSG